MIGSSLTTMAAFLPLTFLNDLTGQFFGPLALVMIATLGVSLALALLLDTHCLPAGSCRPRVSRIVTAWAAAGSVRTVLEPACWVSFRASLKSSCACIRGSLRWCLRTPRPCAGDAAAPCTWRHSIVFQRHPETGFFPDFDEGGFILGLRRCPPGTSLEANPAAIAGRYRVCTRQDAGDCRPGRGSSGAQLAASILLRRTVGDMSVRLKSKTARAILQCRHGRAFASRSKPSIRRRRWTSIRYCKTISATSPAQPSARSKMKIFGPDESDFGRSGYADRRRARRSTS